jgi:hypothetical protein
LSGRPVEHELLRFEAGDLGQAVAERIQAHQPGLQLTELGGHGVEALAQIHLGAGVLLGLQAGQQRAQIGGVGGHRVAQREVMHEGAQDHDGEREHQREQGDLPHAHGEGPCPRRTVGN